jgi:hypothetical protein
MFCLVPLTLWRVNESAAGETWHQWQDVFAYASTMSTKALTSPVIADYCNISGSVGAHVRNAGQCF